MEISAAYGAGGDPPGDEVDGTRSVLIDRAIEQACVLSGDALQALHSLLADLEVFPARMLANLDLTGGLINAEAVMLELAHPRAAECAQHQRSLRLQRAPEVDSGY
jgi:adenylosuccinate lyase